MFYLIFSCSRPFGHVLRVTRAIKCIFQVLFLYIYYYSFIGPVSGLFSLDVGDIWNIIIQENILQTQFNKH